MFKLSLALIICVVVLTLSIPTLADSAKATADSTQTSPLKIKTWGYFQEVVSSRTKSFGAPWGVFTVAGKFNPRTSFQVEAQSASNWLFKAFVTYEASHELKLRIGQQANPFKCIEYPAEDKNFAYFSVLLHYVPNLDDIGLSLFGSHDPFAYYFLICNGTGRNQPDSNSEKEFDGYLAFRQKHLLTEVGLQTGKQPTGYRQGRFVRMTSSPIDSLTLQAGYVERRDLDDRGGYLVAMYGFQPLRLTSRVSLLTQREKPVYTLGAEIFSASQRVKLQPNIIVGKGKKPEFAFLLQIMTK